MSWEHFTMVCDSRIDFAGAWARVAAWQGKKSGSGPMDFTLLGLGYLFQFYPRYVDFSGTSSDADDGRDTSVVFILPSIGRI